MKRTTGVLAALIIASGALLAGCSSSSSSAEPGRQAADGSTCDWDGTSGSILQAGDATVATLDLAAMASEAAGFDVTILKAPKARELDQFADPGPTAASATDPMGVPRARLVYSLQVGLPNGNENTWSLQLAYTGLCFNDATIHLTPWLGSTGVTAPELELGAALAAAEEFRAANPDAYPAGFQLSSVNLMQSTTAPPDFGLLRYYVNYADPANPNVQNVVSVYMDGSTVDPIG